MSLEATDPFPKAMFTLPSYVKLQRKWLHPFGPVSSLDNGL